MDSMRHQAIAILKPLTAGIITTVSLSGAAAIA